MNWDPFAIFKKEKIDCPITKENKQSCEITIIPLLPNQGSVIRGFKIDKFEEKLPPRHTAG